MLEIGYAYLRNSSKMPKYGEIDTKNAIKQK